MHGLVTLFFEVIVPAIILHVVGLVAPCVLVVLLWSIVVSVVLMRIVGSFIIAVVLVTLMVVVIFMTVMLTVAQFTAMHDRKLSRFLFCWMLVLGNLLKNTSRLVGCLTLLKEGNHLE